MIQIVTGDTIAIPITITIDGTAFAIPLTSTVKAVLRDGETKLAPATYWTLASTDSGIGPSGNTVTANWPAGIPVLVIPGADTQSLSAAERVLVELEITLSGGTKISWISSLSQSIKIVKGLI